MSKLTSKETHSETRNERTHGPVMHFFFRLVRPSGFSAGLILLWMLSILCISGSTYAQTQTPGQPAVVHEDNRNHADSLTVDSLATLPVDASEADPSVLGQVERTSSRIFALVAVLGLLLIAITRWKLHPFLVLVVSSLLLGPFSGLAPEESVEAFLGGFAGTMKWIGVVIVLGALIGELLSQSGGTLKIANTILAAVGAKRLPLAMGITGYVVSIPAFVDIAYIMLRPIVEVLAVKSGRNVLMVGLSLAAGLTASHALLPPTPGPLATAAILGADLGRVIMINVVVAAFAVTGGLLWATFGCGKVRLDYDDALTKELRQAATNSDGDGDSNSSSTPSFWLAIAPILLPLVLIAVGAFMDKEETFGVKAVVQFLSIPVVALLCGMLVGIALLRRGSRFTQLSSLVEKSIESSAVVLMITAAGGGFGGVIKATGVGDDIAALFTIAQLPPVLFPFLLAATLTTATGSLTVSMVTSSSVVASMLPSLGMSPEFAVALIGAGSLCIIHANSSFFWLLSRLHKVPPEVLYKTYSVQSVCMALGGLAGALLLHAFGLS